MFRNTVLVCCLALLSACATTFKLPEKAVPVTVDPVFTDHMVLQRQLPVRVWGKANPNEPIKVVFAGHTRRTMADTNGNWSVLLPSMKASAESRELVVSGHNDVTIKDVLVGEVWLCSGQSNMQWGLLGIPSGKADAQAAHHPNLRLYSVELRIAAAPQTAFNGTKGWVVCSPENVTKVGNHYDSFTAAGFYFGRELQAKLGVPVGLIQSAWGGTRIEPWTPQDKPIAGHFGNTTPGAIYNAMISPMIPMTIRGAIWYQGESNLADKGAYEQKMKDLISSWRSVFQRPDMPFYFVEIAPFRYGGDDMALGELRAAQARVAASVPHTGMIHTIDNPTDVGNIHPVNKLQTGERLARLALADTYGVKVGKSVTGPRFLSAAPEQGGVLVKFAETAGSLMTVDGKAPGGFEVKVADGKWIAANAEIRRDEILVTVPGEASSGVRFCWHQTQQSNLRNAEGFPPSPFMCLLP